MCSTSDTSYTSSCPAVLHSQQPTYDLDPAALEKRYKLLQWQLHPDKSAGKTPEERQYSADQATLINQAYGVLRNPLSRANYMVRSMTHQLTCVVAGKRLVE
jgi:DnaJ-domain-containing protein 1